MSSCAGFCPVLVAICKWSDEYEFWWRFRSNRFGTLLIPKRWTGAGGLTSCRGSGACSPGAIAIGRAMGREPPRRGSLRVSAYSLGTMRTVSDSILLFGFQPQSPSWSYRATSGVPFSERATTG